MPNFKPIKQSKKRGSALLTTVMLLMLLAVATGTYVSSATQNLRAANRQQLEIQTSSLCDAGVQYELQALWKPFKVAQNFTSMDTICTGATTGSPVSTYAGTIPGVGAYSVGVTGYTVVDTYTRRVNVRVVGWIDTNGNGLVDTTEPQKTVDVVAQYKLDRSPVFDYTYFINNYGWMDGFGVNDLIVNGDMRSNGDFSFTNGSPTVNGSVYATHNEKLVPAPVGLVNTPPVKWDDTTYNSTAASNARWRPGYSSSVMGAKGSAAYENWRDVIFESNGSIVNGRSDGAVVGDVTGIDSWIRTSSGATATKTLLDSTSTQEIIMPDLSNLAYYQNLSSTWTDPKQTYQDGTSNPLYGQGAYLKVWNTSTNSYQTITTNGQINGSASVIGTAAHPILIHGPVTFSQDCVIAGTISGQGTIYTGRNVHIVGSIIYANPPDFRGTNEQTVENANEKKDVVAFAARASVMMGDTSQFTSSYPLQYMSPPFTHGRYDDNGNWIPPYDATQVDSTGFKKYQSVLGDSYIHSIASAVNQMDAVIYSNFCGGGDIGTGGAGVKMNGSIITKDEAMVVFSLPMYMNYDSRIKEKELTQKPLIDVNLPRSPVMLRSTWQDRGFRYGASGH